MSDIATRFDTPALTAEQHATVEGVREAFKLVVGYMEARVPNGRERAHAVTKLEEAFHWAVDGIARG